jgi:hypothetical protein
MDNITVKVESGSGELVIREGRALEVKPPENIQIIGQITAPYDYTIHKDIEWKNALLVVDIAEGKITFTTDVHAPFGVARIQGMVNDSRVIEKFGINADKKYTSKELAKIIKLNLFYFADHSEAKKVMIALNKFEAKISTTLEDHKDSRGNMKNLLQREVESNVPETITFKAPIIEGQSPIEFVVDICAESTNTGVEFYLESTELLLLLEQKKERLILEQVGNFDNKLCPIIFI